MPRYVLNGSLSTLKQNLGGEGVGYVMKTESESEQGLKAQIDRQLSDAVDVRLMAKTVEKGLREIEGMLDQMRALASLAGMPSTSDDERRQLQEQVEELKLEIDRIQTRVDRAVASINESLGSVDREQH